MSEEKSEGSVVPLQLVMDAAGKPMELRVSGRDISRVCGAIEIRATAGEIARAKVDILSLRGATIEGSAVVLALVPRCSTCDHWERIPAPGWSVCGLSRPAFGDGEILVAEMRPQSRSELVFTGPDFGCRRHSALEQR
jgi:hypothetical protein